VVAAAVFVGTAGGRWVLFSGDVVSPHEKISGSITSGVIQALLGFNRRGQL
jgi:hypothetical protein